MERDGKMGRDLKGKELGKGITQRPDGTYMARFTDKYKKRHAYYDKNLKVIERKLADAKYEYAHGVYGLGDSITLDEWFEQFIKLYKVGKVKETTIYKNRAYFNSIVSKSLGMMKIQDIKGVHLQEFLNSMFDKGLSYGTVANIKSLLGDMFKKAVANEFILRNPCDSLVMPKKPKITNRYLTKDEQERFMDIAKDYYHYDIFQFALTTGMRIGEILGIKWNDIDFKRKTISIKRTLHYSRLDNNDICHFFYTTPKTEESIRTIPLLEITEKILKNHRKKQLLNKMQYSHKWKEKEPYDDLVFTTKDGVPVRYGDVNRTIKNIIDKVNMLEQKMAEAENREAKIMEPFSPHCFRHTYVTRCRENKVPFETIQAVVGHTTKEMTMHYDHEEKALDISLLNVINFF